ncbi:MAG: tautomerase family protein [Actinomycetota bacterium]
MPLYRALVRPQLLDLEQRQAFATDVVDVHCGVTGAPPSFVHVVYADDDDGHLADGQNAAVFGTIRHGRNAEQKNEITSRLSAALAGHAGVAADTVTTTLADIDASYTMEGGVLLPDPGTPEEAEWKAMGAPS